MRQLKHLPIYLGVVAASFGYQAQAQKIAESVGNLSVEEIIVTARKTEESIQDIPFSIQAVSEKTIADRDYKGLADIARTTPGFTFESFATAGATANAVIRGQAQTQTTARIQNVSVFLNGVYLQRQGMINSGLLDVQRVEILKGPQSALFGRNAFAGAINYITSEPSDIFGGKVTATVGSDDRMDLGGSITGPIIEDKLLGKFSYSSSEFDGATENDHIYAGLDVPGWGTEDNLGGYDNEAFSTGLTFLIRDDLSVSTNWYHTDMASEYAPYYTIRGARTSQVGFSASGCTPNAAPCTTIPPGFAQFGNPGNTGSFLPGNLYAQNDLNANPVTLPAPIPFATFAGTGNTLWNGKLPYTKPGNDGFIVDPRSGGTLSTSDIVTLKVDWEINDDWSAYYLYGYADNSTETSGGADGYEGSWFTDTAGGIYDSDPVTPGPQAVPFFNRVNLQSWNGTPNADLTSDSHEVRFEWAGNDLVSASFGLFYSDVKDQDYSLFAFTPICGEGFPVANCMQDVGLGTGTPLSPAGANYGAAFQSGKKSGFVKFHDEVYSAFATLNFTVTDDVSLVLEGRYTQEDKSVERITGPQGQTPDNPVPSGGAMLPAIPYNLTPEDSDSFYFFAPRASVNWQITPDNLAYFTIAKGEKTGGFNSNANIPSFDPETNWTYELGAKNTFLDNTVILNASLYYVDWKDLQGGGSVAGTNSPFTATPTDNIGNARNLGLEVDGLWNVTENWSVDAGLSLSDPYYKDTIYAEAVNNPGAGTVGYFACNGTYCPADGDVSGNQVARTSKEQYFGGVNYQTVVLDGWGLSARLSAAYQSRQYAESLNSAYVPSRTTWDANLTLQAPNNWEINFWGKNIFDKEYASGAFVVAQFNQYIVNAGQARTYGATVTYNFE